MPDSAEATTAAEPSNSSPASARLAASEMYDALPKSKRLEYLGHLNEVLVVLQKLTMKAGQNEREAV